MIIIDWLETIQLNFGTIPFFTRKVQPLLTVVGGEPPCKDPFGVARVATLASIACTVARQAAWGGVPRGT